VLKTPFRSKILPLAALLAPSILLGGCDRQSAGDSQPQEAQAAENAAAGEAAGGEEELNGTLDRSKAGSALPDFTFTDLGGTATRLPDVKGTPVLINLWATWCAPCVLEMPMLDSLAAEHAGKLRVLAVSQDMKGAEAVQPFWTEKGFKRIEVLLDPMNELSFHSGGGAVLPTTILYDAQGREVWRVIGGYDWSGPAARALVSEALPQG
jgi:thiol-disulfide isomerase/thioredoxin